MAVKIQKIKSKINKKRLPVVSRDNVKISQDFNDFPLDHYSYSSMAQFTSNPVLFKIKYVNGDRYNSTTNISAVIGQAFHAAMDVYYGGNEFLRPENDAQAIEYGLKTGMDFLNQYNDGWIDWSVRVPNKQKAMELFAFAFNSYVKEVPRIAKETISTEEEICEKINVEWRGRKLVLPVKLKGYIDRLTRRREDGKLVIRDYKTCSNFSKPEEIDGAKMLQMIIYYLLVYAKYGEEPHSMIYEEVKLAKDKTGKQVRFYECVFSENELYFDFFLRLYQDITDALNGQMVYVPNVYAIFDKEISLISYIHRFDHSEEKAEMMKQMKVDNITDLLKKKIQSAGSMKKFMKTVEQKFVSGKNLNYKTMKNEEKIQTKLMEHGLMIQFEDIISGASVDLYRYTPSVGLKMNKLKGFSADIEQVMGRSGVRVLSPIPDTEYIGFEIPREDRRFPDLPKSSGDFNLSIGQTITGENRVFDIRTAPHMLVAGATGSGKSVFLNSIIAQLAEITNVDLHLFDPKQVELFQWEAEAKEYVCAHDEIGLSLEIMVEEMEKRYAKMRQTKARSIEQTDMRYKFLVIDEYADLMMNNKETANSIKLLAQKGRACGIHLIIATQRASSKVIDGDIKVNFPVKAVFRMGKAIDSQVMIDEAGAEKLLGKGDCLFASERGLERLQGYFYE